MDDWPIFNPITGFGGNGPYIAINSADNPLNITDRTGGGCIQNGPFTTENFMLSIGPTNNVGLVNMHCLTRDFSPDIAKTNLAQWVWDAVVSQPNYGAFARRLEASMSPARNS
jgi:tyrosinase